MTENIVRQKSYDFAVGVVRYCLHLKDQRHFEIAGQLLRSGTSIGANVEEAQAGQSRRDFFAKMALASKEAREARYWLRLIQDSDIDKDNKERKDLVDQAEELVKILRRIVKTGDDERSIAESR
jgi:four helix bundle protein